MIAIEKIRELVIEPLGDNRPAYVTSASGLVRLDNRVYIVADDELHLAVFDLKSSQPGRWLRLLPGMLSSNYKERKKQKSSAPMRFMEVNAQTALSTQSQANSALAVEAMHLERDQAAQTPALVLQLRDGIVLHFDSLPTAQELYAPICHALLQAVACVNTLDNPSSQQAFIQDYNRHHALQNQPLAIYPQNDLSTPSHVGRCVGINEQGGLLLQNKAGTTAIYAGTTQILKEINP